MTYELLLLAIVASPVSFYCLNLRRGWSFLDPINTFWPVYILFGVVEFWTGKQGWIGIYGDGNVLLTLGLYVLAGVGVWAGYALPAGPALGRKLPLLRGQESDSRFIVVGTSMVTVGALAYLYVIHVSGGLSRYLSVSRTAIDYEAFGGYTLNLLSCVSLGLLVLLCTTYHNPRYRWLRKAVLLAMAAFGFWCIYSGTRSGVILVVINVLGSIYGARRRNPPLIVGAFALAAIVLLVGFIAQYRGQMYGGQFHSVDNEATIFDRSMAFYTQSDQAGPAIGSEFGMSLAVVSYVPNAVPLDCGYMLLDFIVMPIPRALWPGKIYPGGESWDRLHRVAGTATWVNGAGLLSGPAPGLVGKYFYMAGPLGVALGSLWTGIFLRSISTYAQRYSGVTGVLVAVGCWILGFSEMNNPLAWPLSWLPATGFGILLTAMLGRRGAFRANRLPHGGRLRMKSRGIRRLHVRT